MGKYFKNILARDHQTILWILVLSWGQFNRIWLTQGWCKIFLWITSEWSEKYVIFLLGNFKAIQYLFIDSIISERYSLQENNLQSIKMSLNICFFCFDSSITRDCTWKWSLCFKSIHYLHELENTNYWDEVSKAKYLFLPRLSAFLHSIV